MGCSIREIARRLGVSDTAINKARADGRVPASLFGKKPSGRPYVLDPDEAERVIGSVLAGGSVTPITKAPPRSKSTPAVELPGEDVDAVELPEVAVSRKRTEHFKALQAELDYRVDAKQYVLIEDVATQVEKEYTAVARRLRAIKVTLAPELLEVFGDAKLVELENMIDTHVNEALMELSNPHADGAFTQGESGPKAVAKA